VPPALRHTGANTAFSGELRVLSANADTCLYLGSDTDAAAEMLIIVNGVTGFVGAHSFL
jgi:hypothetical protein